MSTERTERPITQAKTGHQVQTSRLWRPITQVENLRGDESQVQISHQEKTNHPGADQSLPMCDWSPFDDCLTWATGHTRGDQSPMGTHVENSHQRETSRTNADQSHTLRPAKIRPAKIRLHVTKPRDHVTLSHMMSHIERLFKDGSPRYSSFAPRAMSCIQNQYIP